MVTGPLILIDKNIIKLTKMRCTVLYSSMLYSALIKRGVYYVKKKNNSFDKYVADCAFGFLSMRN